MPLITELALVLVTAVSLSSSTLGSQQTYPTQGPLARPAVVKIREGVYKIGAIEADTLKREVTVPATVNSDVTTLEFVANEKGGAKAYESALTVSADATTLNAALLLIGLDPAHARVPVRHFDPVAPKGDPVEMFVAWGTGSARKQIRIEQLLYDKRTNAPMANGPWVYTGSAFSNGRFLADLDGVLVGFVHSPSPLIENPRDGAVDAYGSIVLNPNIELPGGTQVTLIIRALGPATKDRN